MKYLVSLFLLVSFFSFSQKVLNENIKKLEKENHKITEELLETRDEVFDWKQKYKNLKKTVTG